MNPLQCLSITLLQIQTAAHPIKKQGMRLKMDNLQKIHSVLVIDLIKR